MKVLGIIAEYNPFHKGHAYQIETLKKETDADYAVIAMSGNFVQRGAPALMEKYSRTRMALSCGADLVLELPVLYAAASAEYFARGGVALLENTGVVTHLGFGTETERFGLLQETADFLNRQPKPFRQVLQQGLKEGLSFPAARSLAIKTCLVKEGTHFGTCFPPAKACPEEKKPLPGTLSQPARACSGKGKPDTATKLEQILASPNNILAIEYLKALAHYQSNMLPCPLLRQGQGYHDTSSGQEFPSASAIRTRILEQGYCQESIPAQNPKLAALKDAMPKAAFDILKDYPQPFLQEDDFSTLLHYKLLTEPSEQLSRYADVSYDLARRLKKETDAFFSWSGFCARLKSKNITYARLSRMFLHIILNIYETDYRPFPEPSYLRVLGFRKQAAPLLTAIKSNGKLPIITSPANALNTLGDSARGFLACDLKASSLYRIGLAAKGGSHLKNDYQHPFIRL